MTTYSAKNFDHLLGLAGLSDELLKNHFTLYNGYVTNTNKLAEALRQFTSPEQFSTPEFAEIKRRFGWEWNGMRLHELYFENLSKQAGKLDSNGKLANLINDNFGSLETLEMVLRGTASMRGIGWTILYFDNASDRLIVSWVNEHDTAHLAGAKPLLVIDVFEHAFMLDYGLKRADYLNAVFKAIDWQTVENRL